jgi:hypothetical protein
VKSEVFEKGVTGRARRVDASVDFRAAGRTFPSGAAWCHPELPFARVGALHEAYVLALHVLIPTSHCPSRTLLLELGPATLTLRTRKRGRIKEEGQCGEELGRGG